MSRQPAPRNLTLTEELEKLEQSITLTLQEIDSNFSKAHRIVTGSILPVVEQYGKHSNDVWEGSKFWKQFFEASANVSLSGYEEAAIEEDVTHTDTTSTALETPTDHGEYLQPGAQELQDDDEEFSVDSPTQITGVQTTPKIGSASKRANVKAPYRSPSPRKYTGKNPLAMRRDSEEPSTPRPQNGVYPSSPFEPESAAYHPSTQRRPANNDPLMHRVLDKNYRVQATPHTQRRQHKESAAAAPGAAKATPATTTKQRAPWDDSPQSSPEIAAPELRSDLFSPVRPPVGGPGHQVSPSSPQQLAKLEVRHPQLQQAVNYSRLRNKTYNSAKERTSHIFSDDEDTEEGLVDMSPPKTMQFHVPQSRLMQTPAREASKRIVEDLLLTAGADDTDDMEGADDEIDMSEPSPSVVRRVWEGEDHTF